MTNQNTAQVPKLRFPGFEGAWNEAPILKKLKKVIDYRGKAPPKADQGIPLITARNVRDGYLDFTADEYIEESEYESWMSRGIPKENDVLFTTEAPLGNLALFPKGGPYALGQRIITLQANSSECDSIFLFQLLRSNVAQQLIDAKGTGSTAKGIKSKVFVQIPLHFPKVPEQQKIAAFLTAVDGRIEQLSRKKALLEATKKGVMQQLFTQTLRFQDDHGHDFPAWEEKTLGEFAPLQRGFDLPTTEVQEGSVPVVYSNGILRTHNEAKVKGPGVVTGRSGTIGKVTFVEKDYWPHNTSLWVTNFFGNDPKFVYFFFLFLGLERFQAGSTIPTLNRNDVHAYKTAFPSPPEQTKIAGFLSALDGKIRAVGEQMRQTQAWKKGLLQQMFV